jgi:hypothetical protein
MVFQMCLLKSRCKQTQNYSREINVLPFNNGDVLYPESKNDGLIQHRHRVVSRCSQQLVNDAEAMVRPEDR